MPHDVLPFTRHEILNSPCMLERFHTHIPAVIQQTCTQLGVREVVILYTNDEIGGDY